MLLVDKAVQYRAFGFTISSEIPFVEQRVRNDTDSPIDVVIAWGDVYTIWEEFAAPDDVFVIRDDYVLFHIEDTATYMVKAGQQVIVTAVKDASLERIRLFLDGYCMAVLLQQRRIFPLHGSAIARDGKAYAIVGRSGAGKSTLTKALLDQGFSFLSDDVIPVLTEQKLMTVMPALPEQKLWQQSIQLLDLDSESFRMIYERESRSMGKHKTVDLPKQSKYAVPVAHFDNRSLPLAGIFEIVKATDIQEKVSITPVKGPDLFQTFALHTFNRALIIPLGLQQWHFNAMTRLAKKIPVHRLSRDVAVDSISELVQYVEQVVEQDVDLRKEA